MHLFHFTDKICIFRIKLLEEVFLYFTEVQISVPKSPGQGDVLASLPRLVGAVRGKNPCSFQGDAWQDPDHSPTPALPITTNAL